MRWHPGIGDPTAVGWLTVAGYVAAAAVAVWCWSLARSMEHASAGSAAARDYKAIKRFWIIVGATMAALGCNKQLDLQTLLIHIVRRRAYVDGWYGERRRYQKDFIAAMAFCGVAVIAVLGIWLRRVVSRVFLVIAGLAMLVVFVLVRASSFHYVDRVLALGGSVRVSQLLELGGIMLIVLAMLNWRRLECRDRADGAIVTSPAIGQVEAPV